MSGWALAAVLVTWLLVSALLWVFAPGRDSADQHARVREELRSARRRERVRVEAGRGEP